MIVNIILVLILVAIFAYGLRSTIKHAKGEGDCCGGGGGGGFVDEKKELEGPVIGKKLVKIEGMHCDNCKHSVERAVNLIEGASCTVNLKKNQAVVSMDRQISDEDIRKAIEARDFKVSSISPC